MFKNWKTTLAGLGFGILTFLGQAASARATNPAAPPFTFGNIAPGLGMAVIGALAKDHDVTGGAR